MSDSLYNSMADALHIDGWQSPEEVEELESKIIALETELSFLRKELDSIVGSFSTWTCAQCGGENPVYRVDCQCQYKYGPPKFIG